MEIVPLSLSSKPTSTSKPSWVEVISILLRAFFLGGWPPIPVRRVLGTLRTIYCQVDTEMELALEDVDRPLCWGQDTPPHTRLGLRTEEHGQVSCTYMTCPVLMILSSDPY